VVARSCMFLAGASRENGRTREHEKLGKSCKGRVGAKKKVC